ncbi:beta-glucosidase 24-like [Chenopodium quinoa]|uniref:Beta-glucosidase n=1 Tax=Chenopodium quinoa TaxID=63459 RepID=A0A803MBC2_CHEQI|nr:beta-glucosidase 24-like [Chenopodium quinoa]
MALSYSVASTCAAPSNYQRHTKFPTVLGANKYYTNQINVLANRGSHYKVASPSSLTVISKKLEPSNVVLVDGFEPASLNPPTDLKRCDFPSYFKFGASTSALQTEGPGTEGGRGKSTWDSMIQADKGGKGVDSYNMYLEDIKLLKAMGMNSYRFSIAWPRILPEGSQEDGPINQEGIDFYNKFIDALIAEGIEPVITLFHFDLPVALQDKYHGFMNSQIVEDFKKYADICFANFGDRVKFWSTINEPYVFGSFGYKQGLPNDGKSDLGPFVATHNIILAHAAAAQIYHENYQQTQKGKIGISLPCKWYEPHSTNPTDVVAAQKQLDFMLGWYMDPFVNGDYPESMKESIRELPEFTSEQRTMLQESCDFIGINYYTARFGKQTTKVDLMKGTISVEYTSELVNADGTLIGEQSEGQEGIYVNPAGLRNLLLYITEKYDEPELYVTENGVPAKPTITGSILNSIKEGKIEELKAALFDDKRISHVEDHLTAIREANKQGADVRGYFVWTLMDNMEVGEGYDVRFGLNYTDYYDNLKRYPKKSAKWFTNFLATPPKKNKL